MCMAVDETASKNKTSVTYTIGFATVIALILLHLIIVTAEQHDKVAVTVVMEDDNHGKGDRTNQNIKVHGPPETSSLDARQREAPTTSSWGERLFNASAHEVPSGPNPISNR